MKTSLYFSSCHFPRMCSRCTAHLRFSRCSRWWWGRVECAAVLICVRKKNKTKTWYATWGHARQCQQSTSLSANSFCLSAPTKPLMKQFKLSLIQCDLFFVANFQNELMLSTEWTETVVPKMFGFTEILVEVSAIRPHPSCYIILFRMFRVDSPLIFIVPAVLYRRILGIWWPKNYHLRICCFKDGICCQTIQMFWSCHSQKGFCLHLQSHFMFLFLLFVTLLIFEYYSKVFIIIISTLLQSLLSVLTNEAFVNNHK